MKKGNKHRVYQLMSLLLIVVMAMLTFNQSVNIHTHQLNDGSIVTHAHPYQKTDSNSPSNSHQHSKKEFAFIGMVELLFFVILTVLAVLLTPRIYKRVTSLYIHIDKCESKRILGRAPPYLNSL